MTASTSCSRNQLPGAGPMVLRRRRQSTEVFPGSDGLVERVVVEAATEAHHADILVHAERGQQLGDQPVTRHEHVVLPRHDERRPRRRQPGVRTPQLVGVVQVDPAEMPLTPDRLTLGFEERARAVAAAVLDDDDLDAARRRAQLPAGEAATQDILVVEGRDHDRHLRHTAGHGRSGFPERGAARANAWRWSAIGV